MNCKQVCQKRIQNFFATFFTKKIHQKRLMYQPFTQIVT